MYIGLKRQVSAQKGRNSSIDNKFSLSIALKRWVIAQKSWNPTIGNKSSTFYTAFIGLKRRVRVQKFMKPRIDKKFSSLCIAQIAGNPPLDEKFSFLYIGLKRQCIAQKRGKITNCRRILKKAALTFAGDFAVKMYIRWSVSTWWQKRESVLFYL